MSFLQNFKYELVGPEDAPRMVFLHGAMGSGANWRKIIPAFKDQFRILTYDQRGHGWSFKPKSGYAPEDYAQDLKLILKELGWTEIILIGHSMGGRNALHFADKYPNLVKALVIEDIGPQGNFAAMQKTIDLVEMVPVPFADKQAAKKYFSEEFVQKLGGGERARILGQYFYTNIEQKSDKSADWRFSKNAIITSLREGHFTPRWDAVENLHIPTLFIRGERSEDLTHDEFQRILMVSPYVKGVEIADAGHWVHFDQPDAFIRVLKVFLRDNLGLDLRF